MNDYDWDLIRQAFSAAEQAEPEPELDPATIELSDWSEARRSFGLGTHDIGGDFLGVDQGGGDWPDWRHPVEQPEHVDTSMGEYAAERAAAGIKTASAVFGAASPQPRGNPSPHRIT